MNRGYVYEERIDATGAGRTVLEHLARAHPHGDRDTWRARIETGEVRLDGRPVTQDQRLRPGQVLAWHRPPWEEPVAPLEVGVVYEDGDLLVVDKPSGLPTLPGAGYLEHTLLHQVRRCFGPVDPVHRLGRGTSGLVLFARSDLARRALSQALHQRRGIEKVYLAVVEGTPARDRFEVHVPIGPKPDPVVGRLHQASPEGKPARSEVWVVTRAPGRSLCAVRIETGRPHQIRIHLAVAGHPLLGDPLYGPGGGRRPGSQARPGDTGYALHAYRLRFIHPASGARCSFEVPPPVQGGWEGLADRAGARLPP